MIDTAALAVFLMRSQAVVQISASIDYEELFIKGQAQLVDFLRFLWNTAAL